MKIVENIKTGIIVGLIGLMGVTPVVDAATYDKHDVNGDGQVTAQDALEVLNCVVGNMDCNEEFKEDENIPYVTFSKPRTCSYNPYFLCDVIINGKVCSVNSPFIGYITYNGKSFEISETVQQTIYDLICNSKFACVKVAYWNDYGVRIDEQYSEGLWINTGGYIRKCDNIAGYTDWEYTKNKSTYSTKYFDIEKSDCKELIDYLTALCNSLE